MKQLARMDAGQHLRYELRFPSLFEGERGFAFPCDADGHVNIAGMSERNRCNYFYARKVFGRQFSVSAVAIVD